MVRSGNGEIAASPHASPAKMRLRVVVGSGSDGSVRLAGSSRERPLARLTVMVTGAVEEEVISVARRSHLIAVGGGERAVGEKIATQVTPPRLCRCSRRR